MQWTPEMDRRLVNGVKAGKSRGQMAIALGVSRGSAIIRYARIHGRVFPSEEAIVRERAERIAKEAAERDATHRAAIAALDRDLKNGTPRSAAFKRALKKGATANTNRAKRRAHLARPAWPYSRSSGCYRPMAPAGKPTGGRLLDFGGWRVAARHALDAAA